ncbi:hypothetical protein [Paenibacillus polymyxa]|uniref:hypothetical protein n=1 Tax=Paenibacillus polymyxa TaxID=1406 RepID=UPI002379C33A|nr:hypothetical protein [Paenibacillus polymyxa]WDM21212.1 hypothetical protein J4I02_19920 [Paenibacillus polymyxa]
MNYISLKESLISLQNLPDSPLSLHVLDIVNTERTDSKIVLEVLDKPEFFSLLLVTTNAKEDYWNMHLFYMDQVERNNGQYRYHSFSITESLYLHNCFIRLFNA